MIPTRHQLRCVHWLTALSGCAQLKLDFSSTPDLAAPLLKKAILASLQFLFLLVTRLTFLCNFAPGASITGLDLQRWSTSLTRLVRAQMPSAIRLLLHKVVQNCHNLLFMWTDRSASLSSFWWGCQACQYSHRQIYVPSITSSCVHQGPRCVE